MIHPANNYRLRAKEPLHCTTLAGNDHRFIGVSAGSHAEAAIIQWMDH